MEKARWESRGEVELRGRERAATVYAPVDTSRTVAQVS